MDCERTTVVASIAVQIDDITSCSATVAIRRIAAIAVDTIAALSLFAIWRVSCRLRMQVKKNGGFGTPRLEVVTPTGDGGPWKYSDALDLPVRLLMPEETLVFRRVASADELTGIVGEDFLTIVQNSLLKWRPMHALAQLAPWNTVDQFIPFLFKMRESLPTISAADRRMRESIFKALSEQAIASLATHVSTTGKLGAKHFTKSLAQSEMDAYKAMTEQLMEYASAKPSAFHLLDLTDNHTAFMNGTNKKLMPTLQITTALQEEINGGAGLIGDNPRNGAENKATRKPSSRTRPSAEATETDLGPALQLIMQTVVSLSLLGRPSANMFLDRMLELINNLQQRTKRTSSVAGFGRAMDMTTLIRPMLHVRHAFRAAETGSTVTDDPVTQSMLVQARLLQDCFVRLLGRDLTVVNPLNPFHHTRNPVPLNTGEAKSRRPHEFVERVEEGRSRGTWRATAESATQYIRRFCFEHFFPY